MNWFADGKIVGNGQYFFGGKKGGAVDEVVELIKIDLFGIGAINFVIGVLVDEGVKSLSTEGLVIAVENVDHKGIIIDIL